MGHEYKDILSGAATQKGESRLLLDIACKQVTTTKAGDPKRLKARGSFNAEFWAWSSEVDRGWIKF